MSIFEKAKCLLAADFPFYASIVFHLREVEVPAKRLMELTGMPTMCVVSIPDGKDGHREEMWYAREFVESLPSDTRMVALCHEAMHLAFGHPFPWRIGDRDSMLWNAAADYVVNQTIADSVGEGGRRFTIPKDWLCDVKYRGMCAEEVYELLLKNSKNKPSKCCHGYMIHAGKDGTDAAGSGWCQEQDERWKDVLVRAVMSNQGTGQVPGSLERLVDMRVNPKIPWTALLERYVSEVAQNDYDWAYPDSRFLSGVQMAGGGRSPSVYIPDLRSESVKAVVCLDLSGSIGDDQAASALSETFAILRSKGVSEVRFIAVDTKVAMDVTLRPGDEIPDKFPNTGGGTDFRSLFDMVSEEAETPNVMVFFTDLQATFPDYEPSWPVIWVCTDKGSVEDPPFGVRIDYEV